MNLMNDDLSHAKTISRRSTNIPRLFSKQTLREIYVSCKVSNEIELVHYLSDVLNSIMLTEGGRRLGVVSHERDETCVFRWNPHYQRV